MNEHAKIQEQLAIFDSLDPVVHQQVERHMLACAECRDTLVAYQKMDAALHQRVDNRLRYLATQPMVKPKFAPAPTQYRQAQRRLSWLRGLVPAFRSQRLFVLELAGASFLIFLLMLLSLFFLSGGEPNIQQRLASTPTVVEPTVTATPANPSVWSSQLAVQETPVDSTAYQPLAIAGPLTDVRLSSTQWDWAGEQFAAHLRRAPVLHNAAITPWDWGVTTNSV